MRDVGEHLSMLETVSPGWSHTGEMRSEPPEEPDMEKESLKANLVSDSIKVYANYEDTRDLFRQIANYGEDKSRFK